MDMDGSRYHDPYQAFPSYGTDETRVLGPYYVPRASTQQHGGRANLALMQNAHAGSTHHDHHARSESCSIEPVPADAEDQVPDLLQQDDLYQFSNFNLAQETGPAYHRLDGTSRSDLENMSLFSGHLNQQLGSGMDATPYNQQDGQSSTEATSSAMMVARSAMFSAMPLVRNSEPWNPVGAVQGGRPNPYTGLMPMGVEQYPSNTTRSTSAPNNSGWGPSTQSDFGTPLSSMNYSHDSMTNVMPREHVPLYQHAPFPGQMETPISYQPGSSVSPLNAFHTSGPRAGIPTDFRGYPNIYTRSEPGYPSHSRKRRQMSHAPSQITEASTPGTASNYTDEVLECRYPGCDSTFSGKWAGGNRSRHEKGSHHDLGPLECEHSTCKKTFQRSDARRKHYKAHHPELLFGSASARRSRGRVQDMDLKDISAWSR